MSTSLERRCGSRTVPEFLDDIDRGTARENRLMKAWAPSQAGLVFGDHAPGRDGRFLKKSSGAPDFWIDTVSHPYFPDGHHLLEVKYSPCLWKATLKIHDVNGYIDDEAYVLLIFGEGYESPRFWTIVEAWRLRTILASIKPRYDHPGMDGKSAVLVHESEFSIYFGIFNKWE